MRESNAARAQELTVRIGVQPGTERTSKKTGAKYKSLDRVFFLDEHGEKLVPQDCAQIAKAQEQMAQVAIKVYEDEAHALVCETYRDHAAGAVLKAAAMGKNVIKAAKVKTPTVLKDTFDYVAALKSA